MSEEENTFKVSIPLISDEDIKNIDNNFESIVNEFAKKFIKDKDLALAQYIIQKQQAEIEKKDAESHFIQSKLDEANAENVELKKMIDEILLAFYKKAHISTNCFLQKEKGIEYCLQQHKNCIECIKQYFKKKVEEKQDYDNS